MMNKYIFFLILLITVNSVSKAQDRQSRSSTLSKSRTANQPVAATKDSTKIEIPNLTTWKIAPRFGEQIFVPNDTIRENFHQTSLVEGLGVGIGYLGNIGSPAQSKIFFDRPAVSRFAFLDAFRFWEKRPEDQQFLNTKTPYSNVYYQRAGGGSTEENRFKLDLSSNFGKKLNVGFNFDYVYARGFYQSLYNRHINYDFYASYIGDKYKMHAFVANNNFNNSENGGISELGYITNPNNQPSFSGNSLDIPVRMTETWNKFQGRHIYVTNRYDIGNNMEEYNVNDSTKAWRLKENYTSLASVIFTTHYTDQQRRIRSYDQGLDSLYVDIPNRNGAQVAPPRYNQDMDDFMSYYSLKNTLALSMNEGFRDWTKFGLTAFIEYDMRRFSKPLSLGEPIPWEKDRDQTEIIPPTLLPNVNSRHSENVLLIGGMLSKEKGKYLKYKAYAEKDLLNGDYRLEGQLGTVIPFKDKTISVKANAYIKDIMPSFFENQFASKYFSWDNNFNDVNRVFLGGEITFPELPYSKTKISGGVENIRNYIYYGVDKVPLQETGNVQIVSFRLDQNLQYGNFHWDNQVVYQVTSNDAVIPLPTVALYTNVYMMSKIAEVLSLQLGADAHFHTSYYAPGYEPLLVQFYNQRTQQIGNFPVATIYANLNLKNTRFFIMMYNAAQGMGNSLSFTVPNYPIAPRGIRFGLAWRFNN